MGANVNSGDLLDPATLPALPVRDGVARSGQRPDLAPYASNTSESRGRLYDEPGCPYRSAFQRDRDRIIHAAAFRRLLHKTQVFIFHEGDHYRTRLTHSLEVAQIGRSLARHLAVDEDLTEAIALAHDLGHPPFGHAGERALDRLMADAGGFDHNAQSLKVVTQLEARYAGFDGLNLSWETLEGIVKHNGPLDDAGDDARLPGPIRAYDRRQPLGLGTFASLEAQIAALADDIAYTAHDIDDGVRSGLIAWDDVIALPLPGRLAQELSAQHGSLTPARNIFELNRRLITAMIADVERETASRLSSLAPLSADAIRLAGRATVAFSPAMAGALSEVRGFLFRALYRHPRIMAIMGDAERIVADLFARYAADPGLMPPKWAERAGAERDGPARVVADFIAGMTDRYAMVEHARLFDDTPKLR